jgi:para-nitrobenzyl esterase
MHALPLTTRWTLPCAVALLLSFATIAPAQEVATDGGTVRGLTSDDGRVRVFRGIPFAAPPVGERRWQAPHPAAPWQGVRKADAFGNRCVQARVFDDMVFRDEMSEDCLYLNVWTPAKTASERLPVMVWIYGGGFQAGSASEPRQDGEHLARKGVVVVSFNYRLGLFGFFAHPELTKESGRNASGNYGLLDQVAALQWVQKNVAAFGGDPGSVTIFGESAGSFAVSALMASPLTKGLFHRAIGESGAFFTAGEGTLATRSLEAAEQAGAAFGATAGAPSLDALRKKSAEDLLKAAMSGPRLRFAPIIDGYLLPSEVLAIYTEGAQRHVPLLAGWNADEVRAGVVLGKEPPTAASFAAQARERFGDRADALLKLYPAASDAEALESAASLAGDLFIGYATWKWLEVHRQTGRAPVFRYSFDRKIPVAPGTMINGKPATSAEIGARHAGEIEYVFGTLASVKAPWEPADWKLSEQMMSYWTNFARTGSPNGSGVPQWPTYTEANGFTVQHLDTTVAARPDAQRARYQFLDSYTDSLRSKQPAPSASR